MANLQKIRLAKSVDIVPKSKIWRTLKFMRFAKKVRILGRFLIC